MAPTNAPANTEKKPDRLNVPADMLPPKHNITKATPKLAPELMPKIDGPANGFLKAVCNINPQTANALPQSNAVKAWGKLPYDKTPACFFPFVSHQDTEYIGYRNRNRPYQQISHKQ